MIPIERHRNILWSTTMLISTFIVAITPVQVPTLTSWIADPLSGTCQAYLNRYVHLSWPTSVQIECWRQNQIPLFGILSGASQIGFGCLNEHHCCCLIQSLRGKHFKLEILLPVILKSSSTQFRLIEHASIKSLIILVRKIVSSDGTLSFVILTPFWTDDEGQGGEGKTSIREAAVRRLCCYQIERVISIFQLNVIIFQFTIIKKEKKKV